MSRCQDLYKLYIIEGKTASQIANNYYSVNRRTINKWLKKCNIPAHAFTYRPKGYKKPSLTDEHKQRLREFHLGKKLSAKNKQIAIENLKQSWLKGSASPFWKERLERKLNGYKHLRINGRSLYEHQFVMEKIIGRRLYRGENVHHKNGIRTDNRPENLELWTDRWQPPGQRIEDLVAWAKKILRLYNK